MTLIYFADTRFPIERANGAQTMATCHALAARGHDVTLVVRADSLHPPRDPFAFYGVPRLPTFAVDPVATPPSARARRVGFLLAAVQRALRARDAIVYTRDLGLAAFLLQVPAPRRPPLVYESHGVAAVVAEEMPRLLGRPDLTPSAAKLRRLDRRERRVWRRADGYVTITRALMDELTTRYGPRQNIAVVPDGGNDVGSHFSKSGTDSRHRFQPPVAAYAGHLYPWKGVDVFVRALALAPAVRGLIVGGHPGEADLARVQALVRELGLTDRVTMTGLVPPAEVGRRLAATAILVLPNTASAISERYTSPLKLFEYLMLGRAIVASDLPAIREVLTDGQTALLVPPGDARALAAALSRLAADRELAGALGAAASRLAPQYTWARRAERLEAVLAAAR